MSARRRIRNLNDLRQYKQFLNRKLKLRQKILNYRVRKVENSITVPNITRELFRGSQWELFLPPLVDYLVRKFSRKTLIGVISGLAASVGSIKFFTRKRDTNKKKVRKQISKDSEENQLFI